MELRSLAATCLCLAAALAQAAAHGAGGGYVTADALHDLHTLRALAEQGDKRAAFLLGSRFASGTGGVRDDSKAVRWFRAAAEEGLAEAQYNLGVMYASGRGVPGDLSQAAHWYARAAEQGLAEAQFNLGTLYGMGRGVGRDEALAARWLERAAQKGLPQAQYNLAALYEHGRGVRLDGQQALQWYQRAADQGFAPARERHAALSKKLSAVPAGPAPAGAVTAPPGVVAVVAPDAPGWAPGLDPRGYTVQLASFRKRDEATALVQGLPEGIPSGIYRSAKHGKRWYSVVFGSYQSYAQARAAIDELPMELRRIKPWARKVTTILAETD